MFGRLRLDGPLPLLAVHWMVVVALVVVFVGDCMRDGRAEAALMIRSDFKRADMLDDGS